MYNLYQGTGATAHDGTHDAIQVQFRAARDSVMRASDGLYRALDLQEGGVMVKATGASQTRGQFTERKGQPSASSKKNRGSLAELRCEVNKATPGVSSSIRNTQLTQASSEWQAMEYALLQGFLPPVAEKLMVGSGRTSQLCTTIDLLILY